MTYDTNQLFFNFEYKIITDFNLQVLINNNIDYHENGVSIDVLYGSTV